MNKQDLAFLKDSIKWGFIGLLLILVPLFLIYLYTNKLNLPFFDVCLAVAVVSSIGGIFGMGILLFWSSAGDIIRIINKYDIIVAIPKENNNEDSRN